MIHGHSTVIAGRTFRHKVNGAGMGAVLLRKGGPGVGSSYSSIEDYEQTMKGGSLGDITSRLSKLIVKPLMKKSQNISFKM